MMVAFALPEGSEGFRVGFNDAAGTNRSRARAAAVLGDELNAEMIKLYGSGALEDFAAEWFDAGELAAAGVLTTSESDDSEINWALASLAIAFCALYGLLQVGLFLRMLHRQHANKHEPFLTQKSSLKQLASATAKNTKYARDSLMYHLGLEESAEHKSEQEGKRRLAEGGERWLERNEWFAASLSEKDWSRQIYSQQASHGEKFNDKLDAIMERLARLESTSTTANPRARWLALQPPSRSKGLNRESLLRLCRPRVSSRCTAPRTWRAQNHPKITPNIAPCSSDL